MKKLNIFLILFTLIVSLTFLYTMNENKILIEKNTQLQSTINTHTVNIRESTLKLDKTSASLISSEIQNERLMLELKKCKRNNQINLGHRLQVEQRFNRTRQRLHLCQIKVEQCDKKDIK